MGRRIGWDQYFLRIADDVSLRGDCTRRQVGAVLVNPEHKIISTGYNGAPPGQPGCLSDGACVRGRHYRIAFRHVPDKCACGIPWPCAMAVPPGSSYDTGPGSCIAIHAEANALLWAGQSAKGATMYLSEKPCDGCSKLMHGAGVARVLWPGAEIGFTRPEGKRAVHRVLQRLRRAGLRG